MRGFLPISTMSDLQSYPQFYILYGIVTIYTQYYPVLVICGVIAKNEIIIIIIIILITFESPVALSLRHGQSWACCFHLPLQQDCGLIWTACFTLQDRTAPGSVLAEMMP